WRAVSDDLRQEIQCAVLLGAVCSRRRLELSGAAFLRSRGRPRSAAPTTKQARRSTWMTVGAALRGLPLLISPPFLSHLAETSQPAQQQQRRCRLWNRRRRRTRAFHHDVVDAIVPRRRGRAIEHNAKRRIRVVIQPGNTHKRKD